MRVIGCEKRRRLNIQKWEDLVSDYWTFYKSCCPAMVSDFDYFYLSEFAKESIDDYRLRYDRFGVYLKRLSAIELDDLSEPDQISYEVLRQELCQFREYFQLEGHLRPALFPFGPEMFISYYGVDKTTLSSLHEAKQYLARMQCFPNLFKDTERRLQVGAQKGYVLPSVLLNSVIKNITAFIGSDVEDSIWYKPFQSLHMVNVVGIDKLRVKAKQCIREFIEPAYCEFVRYLSDDYASYCSNSISCYDQPDGKNFYKLLIRYHTSLDLSPDDVHKIGLKEVQSIHRDMADLARDSKYENDLAGFRDFLNRDEQFILADKNKLKERFEILSKRIDQRIPEFFGCIPRMTYGVQLMSESLSAQRPVAMAQANPADRSKSGIHWITSLPKRCPTHMHIPLALHEAWPGHLMHMAVMQEIDHLPLFRRINFYNYNSYIEGWALYCERLGLDMGLYDTVYEHYGRLDMEMWRAVRLVVDTGIHAKGWSRKKAIGYMQKYLNLPEETINAEVDRYIGDPAQALSYKLGEQKIRELRQRASHQLGDRFKLKDFHDCILSTGPVTLNILDRQVNRWLLRHQPQ